MSEPTEKELKQIVEIFLSNFNTSNKTKFGWIDGKSYVAKSTNKRWADAIVFENNKELDLQHKSVIWDILYDKIRSNVANKIVTKLKNELIKNGLNEISVHLNFYQKHIINNDKEIDDFCYYLTEFISSKIGYGYPKSYHLFLIPKTLAGNWLRIKSTIKLFLKGIADAYYISIDKTENVRQHLYSYDKRDDEIIDEVKKITSSIEIFRNPSQKEPIIGYGYSELEPRPLPHFGDVVNSEIDKNIINKYNGIILLDCNRPIDEYDLKLITDHSKDFEFNGEIWLIENFNAKKSATRIFPIIKD